MDAAVVSRSIGHPIQGNVSGQMISNSGNDSDSDVDGSFIILSNNKALSTNNVAESPSEVNNINTNVFQLGQQLISVSEDEGAMSLLTSTAGTPTYALGMSQNDESVANNVVLAASDSPWDTSAIPNDMSNSFGLFSSVACTSTCENKADSVIGDVGDKLVRLLEENESLKNFVQEVNGKRKIFTENIGKLEEAVANSQAEAKEQERKYNRSRSVIETLRTRIAELEMNCQLNLESNSTKRLEMLLEEKESLLLNSNEQIIKLKDLVRKLQDNSMLVKPHEEEKLLEGSDVASLTQRLAEKESELKEIEVLMKSLQEERDLARHCMESKNGICDTLKIQLDEQSREVATLKEAVANVSIVSSELEGNITKRDSDIVKLKELLDFKDMEFQQKQALLESALEEKEVYKAQMEEFKSDFEEELKEKILIKRQSDTLENELAQLQMELQEKTYELERLHNTHLELAQEHIERNGSTSPSSEIPSTGSHENSLERKVKTGAGEFLNRFSRALFYNHDIFGNGQDARSISREHNRSNTVPQPDEFVIVAPNSGITNISQPMDSAAVRVSGHPEPEIFVCPICLKQSADQQSLINHAASCGESQPLVFP